MKLLFNYDVYLDILKTLNMEKADIPGVVVVPSQKNWLTPRTTWQGGGTDSRKEKKICAEYFPSANMIVVYMNRIKDPEHFVEVILHECRHAYQYTSAGFFKSLKILRDVHRGNRDSDYYLNHSWTEKDARAWAADNKEKFLHLFTEDENENTKTKN
jgi:hypothetical protein